MCLITTRHTAGAGDAVCLYKFCSWHCPMLHHDIEESLMALARSDPNSEVFKDLEYYFKVFLWSLGA